MSARLVREDPAKPFLHVCDRRCCCCCPFFVTLFSTRSRETEPFLFSTCFSICYRPSIPLRCCLLFSVVFCVEGAGIRSGDIYVPPLDLAST